MSRDVDMLIVGGGLAGGLVALELALTRPDISFTVLEKGARWGGSHTWSFHETDVTPQMLERLRPALSGEWASHRVRFPQVERRLAGRYFSIRSEKFHDYLSHVCGDRIRFGVGVVSVDKTAARSADGREWRAGSVLDGRGFAASAGNVAWQTFYGQDVLLREPHGLDGPLIMDATCEQRGGYRFFYLLPWDERRLLIEDTRYSERAALPPEEGAREIANYARSRGWEIVSVEREERAALPIPLDDDAGAKGDRGIAIGMRAGFFHATTGYSLPDGARVAAAVARGPVDATSIERRLGVLRRRHRARQRVYRFLNRMLFHGAPPAERYRVLQRFYTLPEGVVARFYSGTPRLTDWLFILGGKPPIPIPAAVRCLVGRSKMLQEETA